jgi:hypothetical protein
MNTGVPLPLAALCALALGALFAHVARGELAQTDGPLARSRPAGIVTAFAVFVYLPAVAYFAAFHGDWAYMYFIAWRRVPSAVDLVLTLACAGLVPVGFFAAAPFARTRRQRVVVAMIATPAVVAFALAIAFEKRLGSSATFVQFTLDEGTKPIAASGLGRAIFVSVTVSTAAALWCARLLRTRRRDIRRPA